MKGVRTTLNWLFLIAVLAATACGGYLVGQSNTERRLSGAWADKENALRAVDMHKDIYTLAQIRCTKDAKLIASAELVALTSIQKVDFSVSGDDSAAGTAVRDAANLLVSYRKLYPETSLDPSREQSVADLLKRSGPSVFPANAVSPLNCN